MNPENSEKKILFSDVRELYKILGRSEIIPLLIVDKNERQILELSWKENKNFREIAEIVGLSYESTLKSYHRAIRKLQERIIKNINILKNQSHKHSKKNDLTMSDNLNNDINTKSIFIADLVTNKVKWVAVLNSHGINTIEDLTSFSKKELLLLDNIGSYFVSQIEIVLHGIGLKLAK